MKYDLFGEIPWNDMSVVKTEVRTDANAPSDSEALFGPLRSFFQLKLMNGEAILSTGLTPSDLSHYGLPK